MRDAYYSDDELDEKEKELLENCCARCIGCFYDGDCSLQNKLKQQGEK